MPPGHDETVGAPSSASARRALERGDQIGRYVVLERVGAGGMGAVYAAYDPDLDRKVALKVIPGRGQGTEGTDASSRLMREAQAMAKLSHPNVLGVLDVGRHRGEVFVAMEFVEGDTLDDHVEKKGLRGGEVLSLYVDAGRGLQAAHEAGLVHRDFKPANVMVDRKGQVQVLDFGLARLPGKSSQPPLELLEHLDDTATAADLTRTGALVGTPAYMAPEQYMGEQVDARTDQFSFCVALYGAVYGQRPFGGETPAALAFAVTQGEPRQPPAGVRISRRAARAIRRGLSDERNARWPDMATLLAELQPSPTAGRPVGRWLGAFALGVAGVTAWVSFAEPKEVCQGASASAAEVWNEARRKKLADAFAATSGGYAADSARRVDTILDDYVTTWSQAREQACIATRVHAEQSENLLDRRVACYRDRLAEFDALVAVFEEADASTVRNAVKAARSLSDLDGCADTSFLESGLEPPRDEVVRQQVDAVRDKLLRVRMLEEAGQYSAATEAARPLLEEARAIGYRPLEAEVELWLGRSVARSGDWAEGDDHLERAYFLSMGGVHRDVAAKSSVMLIRVVGSQFGLNRMEDGLQWARHAKGAAHRAPDARLREGQRLAALGVLKRDTEDHDEAVDALEGAAAILEKEVGQADPRLTAVLRDLALALEGADRRGEAITVLERAIELDTSNVGPEHPTVGGSRMNLGLALMGLGKLEAAEEQFRVAIDVFEASVGPDHPNVASALIDLADVFALQGRAKEGVEPMRRAVEIRRKKLGEGHALAIWAHLHEAHIQIEAARFQLGLATARAAGERARRHIGETSNYLKRAGIMEARALLGLGRAEEALPLIAGIRSQIQSDEPYAKTAQLTHAQIHWELGHTVQAKDLMRPLLEPGLAVEREPDGFSRRVDDSAGRMGLRLVADIPRATAEQ